MQKTIISDTSCLILLFKIDALNLLKALFGEVVITTVIAEEFGMTLPEWIMIRNPKNLQYENILRVQVDKGEASAIALAIEMDDCLLILDDQKARKLAGELGLKFTGTLGVIVDAKLSGQISSIRPFLKGIRETNFHLTDELEKLLLKSAGEE